MVDIIVFFVIRETAFKDQSKLTKMIIV